MISCSDIENINKLFLELEIQNLYTDHTRVFNLPLTNNKYDSNNNNEIKYLIYSKKQNLLVIQEMGIAFFLTDYLIKKLPFYQVLLNNDSNFVVDYFYINHNTFTRDKEIGQDSGCKVLVITEQWDINGWSLNKLKKIHEWLPYLCEEISDIPQNIRDQIDYKCIEALGYDIQGLVNS